MKTKFLLLFVIILSVTAYSQVTGLAGWNIFVDPGHSQNENVGAYGYSEAHKVLRVGLNLRQILLTETDIDTVYLSRTDDQMSVGLTQRCDMANTLAAAWYHSIHSDAPSATVNSTLLLWGQNQNGTEKVPNGGKAMSSFITDILTRGYRTNTRGSWGDCSFYGTCSPGSGPYLAVNRLTSMPSELSEAGFHTNLIQNMINMNALWKRLEARTLYWSFLKFKNIARPYVGTVTGHVKDSDNGKFINGAIVSINGQSDTTDTYESLFHSYSSDPNQLRNGFFFFENIPAGTHTLKVYAAGYDTFTTQVTTSDTFFTFIDPQIISSVPPVLVSTFPEPNDSLYPGYDNILLEFNRPMDILSVQNNLVISPNVNVSFNWSNGDRNLTISTDQMVFGSQYSITVSGNSKDKYNHLFDGDGNGIGGDPYTFTIKAKILDVQPPVVAKATPGQGSSGAGIQPVINLTFSEPLNTVSLQNKFKFFRTSDQAAVNVVVRYYPFKDNSVLNAFVRTKLLPFTSYTVQILPGLKDLYGNENTNLFEYTFITGDTLKGSVFTFDTFEGGVGAWKQPVQSPFTLGIITEKTLISSASNIYSSLYSGGKSMKLNYGWKLADTTKLIHEQIVNLPLVQSNSTLRLYFFGDGRNNQFRFCLQDGTAGEYEVSPWYNVDWFGWNEVNWTPSVDGFGTWRGNGVLEGVVRFNAFQFTYTPGSSTTGEYYFDDAMIISNTQVAVEDEQESRPSGYVLEQNYPNPFNPSTKIRFGIIKSGNVKLEVYNLIGQKVASLVNGYIKEGYHTVTFNASDLPSGVYIYKLDTPEFTSTKKLVLLK